DQSRTIAPDGAIVEIQGAAEGCDLLLLLSKHFRKAKKSHRRGWLKGKTDKERKPVRVKACGDCAGSPDQWS
ncbi:hypothetical protein ACTZGP_26275, partial [Pseudomonas putida]|uniref:hypothetical protein n=1 Tax=Pseudomonas putida TaxID=303 RepID=UPI003FD3A408